MLSKHQHSYTSNTTGVEPVRLFLAGKRLHLQPSHESEVDRHLPPPLTKAPRHRQRFIEQRTVESPSEGKAPSIDGGRVTSPPAESRDRDRSPPPSASNKGSRSPRSASSTIYGPGATNTRPPVGRHGKNTRGIRSRDMLLAYSICNTLT